MKKTRFLAKAILLSLFLTVFALNASAQKVTLSFQNETFEKVLNSIKKQTGLSLVFSEQLVDLNRKVSINVNSIPVEDALKQLLVTTNLSYEIKNKKLYLIEKKTIEKNGEFKQSKKITGKVIDNKGEPIIGATIINKGSKEAVITDLDGVFSIEAKNQSVLSVSFIGYSTAQVVVNSNKNLIIKLTESIKALDEVVIMGYSAQKRSELSSSVVTIKADKLTDVVSSDVGNMLQGKIAGLQVINTSGQPGSTPDIRIRGTGSITADAPPLYVVDGIPGGTFNPNDVQTLTVLKDAGATAMYGSAAAGGVIVVTTKSGVKNQPTFVNVKAIAGTRQNLYGNFKMMDSKELFKMQKQYISPALFSTLRPASLYKQNFNWQDAFFKSGVEQNYYVSATGSNNKTTYFTSLDYYNEKGTLINTGFDRISGRVNLNTQLYKNVDINVRISYQRSNTQSPSSWTTLNDAYTKMPWDSPYDKDGNIEKITSAVRADGSTWYSQDKWNALHNELYNYNKTRSTSFTGDFQLNWNIFDWLVFTSSNRYSQGASKNTTYIDPRTFDSSYKTGCLSNAIDLSESIGTTNTLKSTNKFGHHTINGLLGVEWGNSTEEYTGASGISMPNGLDALNATTMNSVEGYTIPLRSYSGFGQVQYSYQNKYNFTFSLRGDENSKFAPEKRLGWFPASAASWIISNEDFLKDNKVITFLKLRGSYGETGNSNIGMYRYLSTYTFANKYQNVVAATPSRLGNPFLGWETAYMAGLGLDVSLWKNIDLNIDLYNTEHKDLLLDVPVSPSTGFFSALKNAGRIRNQGIEFQINSTNIKTKDFKWETSFNIAFNKNVVTETPDDKPILQTRSSVTQQIKRGQDIYSWYMPKWLGVDPANGDPLWEKVVYDSNGNETGRVSTNNYKEATIQVVGKATPLFTGGFASTISYKDFYLSFNANFVYGDKIFNYDRLSMDADGAYLGYNQMSMKNGLGWTRWQKAGDNATHPKLVMNGNQSSNSISSRYLEDGSFFRLKNLKIGYNVPMKTLSSLHLKELKVFASADNLLTFSKFSGMDPEVSLKTTDYTLAGFYSNNYPISRQILFGFEIGF